VDEAIVAFEQLIADRIRILGPDKPQTLFTRGNLAGSLRRSGQVAEAITAFEHLLADRARLLGPDASRPGIPEITWAGFSGANLSVKTHDC
jgi:hypothetical protein